MAKGKFKQKVGEFLHPSHEDQPVPAEQESSQAEAEAVPQEGEAKADPEKDYAAHPKFAKFKGES